MTTNENRERQA